MDYSSVGRLRNRLNLVPQEGLKIKRIQVLSNSVMPLAGGQGGLYPTQNFGVQLTLLQPGGQIMPTALLLVHPDLKT